MQLGSFTIPEHCLKKLRRLDYVDKYDFPEGESTVIRLISMLLLDLSKRLVLDLHNQHWHVPLEEVFAALVDFFVRGFVEVDEVDERNFNAAVNLEDLEAIGLWPLPEWERYKT